LSRTKFDHLYDDFPNMLMPCSACGNETTLVQLKEEDKLPDQELKQSGSFIYQWPDGSWYQQCSCGWARDDGGEETPNELPTRKNMDFQIFLLVRDLLITVQELKIENTLLKQIIEEYKNH
jgi:hypothetical protein